MLNNEEDIMDSLYKHYEQPLYYEAYKILHDEYLAEDAVHEAFLRLIRNREKIQDPTSPRTQRYVYKTLKSATLDIYRNQKKQHDNYCYNDAVDIRCCERNTESNFSLSMLSELPQKYASVMRCLFIAGLSYREASAVLKISETSVRKRCERARKLLKNLPKK